MRIAVVGDHCLDIDYIGEYDGLMSREVERLPVFNCSSVRYSGGGAANIVECLHGLGVEAVPIGGMGDTEGQVLYDIFNEKKITNYMYAGQPTPSYIKYYLKSGQHIFRMNKKSVALSEKIEQNIIHVIKNAGFDAIIVADYDETGNGIVTDKIISAVNNKPCIKIGTSRTNPDKLRGVNYAFMSEKEYFMLKDPEDFTVNVILTKGKSGAVMVYKDIKGIRATVPEEKHLTKDIDICGCGDSFLSSFVTCKMQGMSDLECLKWGNAAGRAQARKLFGAHTLTWEEIETEYDDLYKGVE